MFPQMVPPGYEQSVKLITEMVWNYYRELMNAGFNEVQAIHPAGLYQTLIMTPKQDGESGK